MSENAYLQFLERYGPAAGEEGPVLFVKEVLGATPDPWQERVLRAYGRRERRISIRSCHGPGKTAVAAWICVHQLLCRFPQKTVCTAPTSPQLFDALYAEIKRWMRVLPHELLTLFEIKSDRIELKAAKEQSFLSARTSRADTPEALQGVHSEWVLLIGDEASGIPNPIFEAAAGSMSGHNATTLLLSNPVRTSGFFFDTHHKLKDMWFTVHVSHEDSERVSDDFVKDMARRYGEESNAFRVRCLGEFPRADLDTIIPFELVEAAQVRAVLPAPTAPTTWGLDVARFGEDQSALCKRKGNVILEPVRCWRHLDTMQTAGIVKAEWDDTRPSDRPLEILVDVIGIGAGVVDRLRELKLPVRGINVSETPALSHRYVNLRAELWFKAKEWFVARDCAMPRDEELETELVAVKYKIRDSSGKLQVESKAEMKKRGYPSPDRADAFVLTFGGLAATMLHGGSNRWGKARKKRLIKGIV
jgi:hypothetical protein